MGMSDERTLAISPRVFFSSFFLLFVFSLSTVVPPFDLVPPRFCVLCAISFLFFAGHRVYSDGHELRAPRQPHTCVRALHIHHPSLDVPPLRHLQPAVAWGETFIFLSFCLCMYLVVLVILVVRAVLPVLLPRSYLTFGSF